MAKKTKSPPAATGGAQKRLSVAAVDGFEHNPSNSDLQALASCLHACGARAIYELLADLVRGRDLAETLADFSRLDPALYAAVAAVLMMEGRA
jgi:hypothetical protein